MGLDFEYPDGATPLDPDEAEGLIPPLTTRQELNEFEFLNISEAERWARKSRKIKAHLLSIETLQELHRRMFGETWKWAGRFRWTQKSIGVEAFQISMKLQQLVDDVEYWIAHQTYVPQEIAARFHHRLVSTHPFPNGNGRHARLATDLLAANQGWPPLTWGSANLVTSGPVREKYIQALRMADGGDFALLVQFVRS